MRLDDEPPAGHIPPHSIEAEQSVLGAVLIDNDAFDVAGAVIGEADFYNDAHRRIWRAIAQQIALGKPADAVTITARLGESGDLDTAGGVEYVGSLPLNVTTSRNVGAYVKIVKERSLLRQIAAAAASLHALAVNPMGRTVGELVDDAAKVFDAFGQSDQTDTVQAIGSYLPDLLARIEDRMTRGEIQGLATGLRDLDKMTAGLQKGDLILIAGRPSMGKSALAMQIAQEAALAGKSVVVFSLEMSRDQLLERMISNVGAVDADALRTGQLSQGEWDGISSAFGRLRDVKLRCYDAGDATINRIRSIARRAKRGQGCDLVVLDYLQLLAPEDGENRNAEITVISRGLKMMARELDCPVIALSQLSRKVEERTNKRPVSSDLRDSGALEQDADVIAMLYRDEVYHEESEMKGCAEIIITKQRMGKTGTIYTEFAGEYSRFRDMAYGWKRPAKESKQRDRAIRA